MTDKKPFIERYRALKQAHEDRLVTHPDDTPAILPEFWKCRQCGKMLAPDSTSYREGVQPGAWLVPFYCSDSCFVYGPHMDCCECVICGPEAEREAAFDEIWPRMQQHGPTMRGYARADAARAVREKHTLAFLEQLGC